MPAPKKHHDVGAQQGAGSNPTAHSSSEQQQELSLHDDQYATQTDELQRLKTCLEQEHQKEQRLHDLYTEQTDELQRLEACLEEEHQKKERLHDLYTEQSDELQRLKARLEQERPKKRLHDLCAKQADELERLNACLEHQHQEGERLNYLCAQQTDELHRVKASLEQERQKEQTRLLMAPRHGVLDSRQVIQSLPELKDVIAYAMRKTVNMWIMKVDDVFPQAILPQLFQECRKEMVDCRQGIVNVLLGKVEGATEENVGAARAKEMLDHMRRHHKTLFPLTPSTERDDVLRRVFGSISAHLQKTLGMPESQVEWRQDSGLEKVVVSYLEIIVNVLLQNPPAMFGSDCGDVIQKLEPKRRGRPPSNNDFFDEHRHSVPIDGGSLTEEGRYFVVFPALLESDGAAWTKSYILEYAEPSGMWHGGMMA